jgi:GR25 family glycosyltransferase involved in LPS biosynthesis
MKVAPILIFSYNRPSHLLNLLNSLVLNLNIEKYNIYFFCDGPKNLDDIIKINLIEKIINSFKKKLKFKKIFFRKQNVGLAKNIISGVTTVLKLKPYCIILEDDLELNSMTIVFLDHYLKLFQNKKRIGSVSAHSYINHLKISNLQEYYLTRRHSSWCWGTWSRVWNNIKWDTIDYKNHFSNNVEKKLFSQGGNDLNLLLWGQYREYINSWAIRFNYFCFKKSLLSFQPRYSMINNRGRDFSGTHEKFSFSKIRNIKYFPKLLKKVNLNIYLSKKIDLFIKNSHRKSFKLAIKHFYENKSFL